MNEQELVTNISYPNSNADQKQWETGLRSEMADEIISRKPDFLEKWAMFIFLGILLLLLASTWFIKYPDFVEGRASLTAANAPKEIIPRQEGRLVKLFTSNNGRVSKDEIFGWLESTADHKEVIALSRQVDSSITLLNAGKPEKTAQLFNHKFSKLGETQQKYQEFITALQLFNDYIVNGFYLRKKLMLEKDIVTLNNTMHTIESQKKIAEQDLKLAEETFTMNQYLFEGKILSKEEFRAESSKYLNKQIAIPQLEAAILSNESQKRDKEKELDQLNHDIAQEQMIFLQSIQSLKSEVDDWKRRFVLSSPIEGKISFIIPLQENQFLQQGKLLGYITPDDTHFYAEAYLPQNNFGKIDTGLKVQLRFEAYPYQEVGYVDGTLNYVSNVASDSGFLATVRLDKGLVTNNNKSISYKSGLKAQAVVVTKNMRLLQRLFYNISKSTSIAN